MYKYSLTIRLSQKSRLLRINAYAAMQKIACFESAAIVAEFEQNDARKNYLSGSLCFNAVVGRRVCSRRPSHGVCGSFDDRRP